MRVMAIRYVRGVESAQRFYRTLGLRAEFASRRPREGGRSVWTARRVRARRIPGSASAGRADVQLSSQADKPLELVIDRLRRDGYELPPRP